MFEKEAKKHREEFSTAYISVGGGMKAADMIGMQKELSYEDGANFGYKKARVEANEIIEGLMKFCRCFAQHPIEDIRYKEAEQFLRSSYV